MRDARQKLIGLLDYAFRLSEYRLPDGTTFAVGKNDTQNLPGVRHDHRDDEGAVWLEVERLARKEPPAPPEDIAEWIALSADPARQPEVRNERLVTGCGPGTCDRQRARHSWSAGSGTGLQILRPS